MDYDALELKSKVRIVCKVDMSELIVVARVRIVSVVSSHTKS